MPTKVIMPQLGESVIEGTVTKWLKSKGDRVQEFEPLLEVNTDKVDTEIPSPSAGYLLDILVGEGTTVRAGTVLAWLGEAEEEIPEKEDLEAGTQAVAPAVIATAGSPEATGVTQLAGRSRDLGFISPVVARLAREHNLDLSRIQGSGLGGRITKKDVLAYLESIQKVEPAVPAWETPAFGDLFKPTEMVFPTPESTAPAVEMAPASAAAALPGEIIPHTPIRRAIAEHMVRSKHTSAHVTTVMEADLSRVVTHRQANKEAFSREGVNLTFTAYFVAAAVAAIKAFPVVNSSWSEEGLVLQREINIGIAASLGEAGLIVPVIKHADEYSLLGLARTVNDLANRARNRQLKPDEVKGGTFTITNHGTSGSLFATPIINQPQCAILGAGAIQKRVAVIEGPLGADVIAIRPMAYVSLTFDHRILDGASADQFLGKVVEYLQNWS